jgi:hypothetical protein
LNFFNNSIDSLIRSESILLNASSNRIKRGVFDSSSSRPILYSLAIEARIEM